MRSGNGAPSLCIALGSVGRRVYLVSWFREALARAGLDGTVLVTDADPNSAGFSAGDRAVQMPRYDDPAYPAAMLEMARIHRPSMLIPLNDYEIEALGGDLASGLRELGVLIPGVPDHVIPQVTDKYALDRLVGSAGLRSPTTALGGDMSRIAARPVSTVDGIGRVSSEPTSGTSHQVDLRRVHAVHALMAADSYVVKHRWGSGSSGLTITDRTHLDSAIVAASATAPRRAGVHPTDAVIVQPLVRGTEYGIDLVGDLEGRGDLRGVLARKKLRMRAGETDKASSVGAEPFRPLAEALTSALSPVGLVDVDVIMDDDGTTWVIDVNPRFGGGYPFAHLAGADVPAYYVAHLAGIEVPSGWDRYDTGIVSSKHESIRLSDQPANHV